MFAAQTIDVRRAVPGRVPAYHRARPRRTQVDPWVAALAYCALALVQSQTYANTAVGDADAPWKSFGAVCKDRQMPGGVAAQ